MNRPICPLLLLAAALAFPSAAHAQPRLLVGGGFSAPNGEISSVADPGYHLQAGLAIPLPTLPISLRGDASLHRMGGSGVDLAQTEVLAGVLSLVFHLPGVGLQPYFLGGIGSYRTESGPLTSPVTDTQRGLHAGFGVAVGGLGLGAFAELRFVQIDRDVGTRLVPLTLGLRF